MITDVKFLQKYNEVLNDNFNAVLKQNLLFQTQVAVLEERVKEISDYEEIKKHFISLTEENNDLKNELKNREQRLKNIGNLDTEKHRLQIELNNQYSEIATLNSSLEEKTKYIEQLENMLPKSKKIKLGLPVTEDNSLFKVAELEQSNSDENLSVESTGGTF